MTTLQRTIEFLSLSLWLGGEVFLAFVMAPGAFYVLGNDAQAGAMVRYGLGHMHVVGAFCGLLFLVTRVMRTGKFASLVKPASLCVMVMITLTIISQYTVMAKMSSLRAPMRSIHAPVMDSPEWVEFNRLHHLVVLVEGGVMLAGVAGLHLLVRELRSNSTEA
ncbi:MAG TPA: DUF4149 domain-containing protein [Candidatus Dormibacteraeota bacterium]|nr:DUF4149 domain-containing protein [Candidatus Dormibacteraeota bacterium]